MTIQILALFSVFAVMAQQPASVLRDEVRRCQALVTSARKDARKPGVRQALDEAKRTLRRADRAAKQGELEVVGYEMDWVNTVLEDVARVAPSEPAAVQQRVQEALAVTRSICDQDSHIQWSRALHADREEAFMEYARRFGKDQGRRLEALRRAAEIRAIRFREANPPRAVARLLRATRSAHVEVSGPAAIEATIRAALGTVGYQFTSAAADVEFLGVYQETPVKEVYACGVRLTLIKPLGRTVDFS